MVGVRESARHNPRRRVDLRQVCVGVGGCDVVKDAVFVRCAGAWSCHCCAMDGERVSPGVLRAPRQS